MDDEDQIGGTELAGLSELGGALSMGMYGTESGHKAAQGVLDSYMKKYGGEDADAPEKQFINQMKESSAQVQAALRKARERLIAQRYNPGELLLAASAGLGKPTRTGSIGETFSNLSEAMQGPLARKNQFERERDSDLLKLDTEEAQANQGVNAAELQLEMLNHRLAAGQATKALEVLNRPVRGTGAGGLRDRKIFDTWNILMRQGGMDPTAAYDRAVKLVDGKRRVIADPELGILRIVDDVEGTSEEVPLVDPATGKPAAKAPSTLPNASPAPLASATTPPAAAAGAPKPKPAPTVDTRDVTAPGENTLWNATKLGTGWWSGIKQGYNVVAGNVGLPLAAETAKARQDLVNGAHFMSQQLTADPEDPSYKEIKELKEDFDLLPSMASNPALMQQNLKTIDSKLRAVYARAQANANDVTQGKKFREQQRAFASQIRSFLPMIGVPPEGGKMQPPDWLPDRQKSLWPYWTAEEQQRVMELHGGNK